ncbi:MAG: 30S ribosomal protein S18 [Patescibacteria group bacterium]
MAEVFKRHCYFCKEKMEYIDYKNIALLKRFISPYAKISSRKRKGTCRRHQAQLSQAIKRARYLALLPFVR